MAPRILIDQDIAKAATLPAEVYRDPHYLALQRERIFARSWQPLLDAAPAMTKGDVRPFTFLEGCLDEPLLLTHDGAALHCLSNVCTHRANLVVRDGGHRESLRCNYHGRRFALDGTFISMPEFQGAEGFPSTRDNLPSLPIAVVGGLRFASLAPAFPFEDLIAPVRERVGWLPFSDAVPDPTGTQEYVVRANWALYCDNYLEGFHVPFVHAGLAEQLDYASYRTELYRYASIQTGYARDEATAFHLPPGHRDQGAAVAAWYAWLFPNVMLNFYPWGLSVNVVVPVSHEQTRVVYRTFVWDASRRHSGAGAELHRVELEDEAVVESVQRGVQSRLYDRGRYSPSREVGVHHFHRLIAEFIA